MHAVVQDSPLHNVERENLELLSKSIQNLHQYLDLCKINLFSHILTKQTNKQQTNKQTSPRRNTNKKAISYLAPEEVDTPYVCVFLTTLTCFCPLSVHRLMFRLLHSQGDTLPFLFPLYATNKGILI